MFSLWRRGRDSHQCPLACWLVRTLTFRGIRPLLALLTQPVPAALGANGLPSAMSSPLHFPGLFSAALPNKGATAGTPLLFLRGLVSGKEGQSSKEWSPAHLQHSGAQRTAGEEGGTWGFSHLPSLRPPPSPTTTPLCCGGPAGGPLPASDHKPKFHASHLCSLPLPYPRKLVWGFCCDATLSIRAQQKQVGQGQTLTTRVLLLFASNSQANSDLPSVVRSSFPRRSWLFVKQHPLGQDSWGCMEPRTSGQVLASASALRD